jgi:6-phosphogluconolactonase
MDIATKSKPNLEILADASAVAGRCLEHFVADAKRAVSANGVFRVAISGGKTPQVFFELLGRSPQARSLSWERVHMFWVDERYVPPDSNRSNYKLAADTFLRKIPIPTDNIHRIPTEYADPNVAASCYEKAIRKVFALAKGEIPHFDLVLLGMGSDGHTGSLFPNSYAAFDTDDLVCAVYLLDETLNRVTLTHPVLRAASHLVVLVAGQGKADILKEVLTTEPDDVRYPIHALWPVLDKVTWLVDREAARALHA